MNIFKAFAGKHVKKQETVDLRSPADRFGSPSPVPRLGVKVGVHGATRRPQNLEVPGRAGNSLASPYQKLSVDVKTDWDDDHSPILVRPSSSRPGTGDKSFQSPRVIVAPEHLAARANPSAAPSSPSPLSCPGGCGLKPFKTIDSEHYCDVCRRQRVAKGNDHKTTFNICCCSPEGDFDLKQVLSMVSERLVCRLTSS